MARQITGWKLAPEDRERLLQRFEPHYPRTIADHVTLRFGTHKSTPLPTSRSGDVVGVADDGRGVQALVVRIGGTTDRGDGSHYHITWSLADGRKAKESNDLLKAQGWDAVPPIEIALIPAHWSV